VGDSDGEVVTTGVGAVGIGVTTGVTVTTGVVEDEGDACGGPTSKYVVAYDLP
jgi:hypothetical protein